MLSKSVLLMFPIFKIVQVIFDNQMKQKYLSVKFPNTFSLESDPHNMYFLESSEKILIFSVYSLKARVYEETGQMFIKNHRPHTDFLSK